MLKACPITYRKIDETAIRMHAGLVSVFGLIFVFSADLVWLVILFYDFFVRVAGYKTLSPLFLFSRFLVRLSSLKIHEVDAGPKQFAAKIGLIFVIGAMSSYLFGFIHVSTFIVAILTGCALLEALFAFCVGCEVYPFWQALVNKKG
ncbi:DUF4395 domain-containing protein [Sulfurimonas sp. HSL-1716]|uniref:DUF4395 domain-containing protein n=1 Tax=Hydrocurvibacter sulfurireducens TaxID=3131937 RepID=UPI0031F7A2DD